MCVCVQSACSKVSVTLISLKCKLLHYRLRMSSLCTGKKNMQTKCSKHLYSKLEQKKKKTPLDFSSSLQPFFKKKKKHYQWFHFLQLFLDIITALHIPVCTHSQSPRYNWNTTSAVIFFPIIWFSFMYTESLMGDLWMDVNTESWMRIIGWLYYILTLGAQLSYCCYW